jgi:hypothetical protein
MYVFEIDFGFVMERQTVSSLRIMLPTLLLNAVNVHSLVIEGEQDWAKATLRSNEHCHTAGCQLMMI